MDLPTIESICLSILRLYSRPKVSCGWLHCEQQACAASFYGCSIYNWVHLLVAFYAVQSWTCVLKYCLSWGSTWSVGFLSGLWHCVTVWFLLTVCYSLVSLPGLHLLKHFSLPSWTFCYGVVSYLMAVFDHISFCILWWCYRLLVISFFYNLSYTPENSPALGLKLILRSDTHTRIHVHTINILHLEPDLYTIALKFTGFIIIVWSLDSSWTNGNNWLDLSASLVNLLAEHC